MIELLAILGIALVAVALMVLAGRATRAEGGVAGGSELRIDSVDGSGMRAGDAIATWSSISEVAVVTRRTMGGPWYGLELQSDELGSLLIDGSDGLVEPFLAESYRLAGFDHSTLMSHLASKGTRAVCYRR